MTQMQLMYELSVEDVIRGENGPLTGGQLWDIAEHHYSENPQKLAAHFMAASVINETGHDVSARFLIWLARQESLIGPKAMHELVDIYAGVHTNSEDTFTERNSNSAWLTRFLEAKGCSVTKAKSKMDER